MRAVRFRHHGDPAAVLSVDDVPVPVKGPDDLLIRMTTRPINPSDLMYVRGEYGREATFPSPAGFEGVGVVERADRAGTYREGARVAVAATGTWQDYVSAAPAELIPVPDAMPDEVACQLTVNPFAARLLVDQLDVPPGGWLLLSAGASAVCRMVLAYAARRRIRCLHLVRRPEQVTPLRLLGADEVIDVSAGPWVDRVLAVTSGGAAAAIDSVGGQVGRGLLDCLRPGGRLVVFGALSGEPIPLPSRQVIFSSLTVRGFWLPERLAALEPHDRARLTEEVVADVADGWPGVDVAGRYALPEVSAAVRHSARTGGAGKVLLTERRPDVPAPGPVGDPRSE
ncbi:zinc-dependent alcohol dehydrogenase family protein [Nonomuraea sp. NPDC003560]|uniref:zinc-dependent alcohol dehydrogenase family protein n=1 Tax=Nonomuraea sp. NPDC003560 TaxID=3364341 RepID=UPI00368475ED